jgi:hypothetical protein
MTETNVENPSIKPLPSRLLGLRIAAIAEAFAMLVALTIADHFMFGGGSFWYMNPHPFWIPVVLIAVQYGTNEGLVTAALASLFLLAGQVPASDGLSENEALYAMAINPVLWVATAWIVGELRGHQVRERESLIREAVEARQREDLIAESYQFVRNRKEALEQQVAGQLTSAIEAYRAAKAVETLDPQSVMRGIEMLVNSVLGPQKFSLSVLHDNKLTVTLFHGWNPADTYLQEIDAFSPLYQAVVAQQKTLVIANAEHEIMLAQQGMMAGPIPGDGAGNVIGMLKFEQMDFSALSLTTVETFRALCEWIGAAMTNARNYQMVKAESIVNPEHHLLTYHYFKRQSAYLTRLAKRVGFNLSMVVIKLNEPEKLSDHDRITIGRQIGEAVKAALRSVDLAFEYQTSGEEYSIVLPATSQAGAAIVRDKIARNMAKFLHSRSEISFTYMMSALHETR